MTQICAPSSDLTRRRYEVDDVLVFGFGWKRWSRLSEQIFRLDKWSLCQG